MSAKKTNDKAAEVKELHAMIEELKAKNEALYLECCDLQKQNDLLVKESIEDRDRCDEERKQRVKIQREKVDLEENVKFLTLRLNEVKEQRMAERNKRHASIPKFVIVSAAAMVVLLASFMLQKVCAIGPSAGYTIQCGMSIIIAWCYALIWDRSRKN